MKPRRYQLKKEAVGIVRHGHPWVFRDQLSTAASVLRDGERLRLVAGDNAVVGYGVYEKEGAIAIRVLKLGAEPPDASWLRGRLEAAVAKRAELAKTTDGIRLLNGESDGVPAVVADRFGDTAVVASYSAGADALARYVGRWLPAEIKNVIVIGARRRHGEAVETRVVRGVLPDVAWFVEDGIRYAVDLSGQKTGTYLDLRALRRELATSDLRGKRVLNLFAYTGMLGRAAEHAGATEIVQVDASERALAFAAKHHVDDPSKHRFVVGDVLARSGFAGPRSAAEGRRGALIDAMPEGQFDLVIVDPPSMTSRVQQVPRVLAAYRKLYSQARERLAPGGTLVAACCTSRIERDVFARTVADALPGMTRVKDLRPEPDHPVGFPQADYLKISLLSAGPDTAPGAAPPVAA